MCHFGILLLGIEFQNLTTDIIACLKIRFLPNTRAYGQWSVVRVGVIDDQFNPGFKREAMLTSILCTVNGYITHV